jgi:Phage terminase large subunit (GpA)
VVAGGVVSIPKFGSVGEAAWAERTLRAERIEQEARQHDMARKTLKFIDYAVKMPTAKGQPLDFTRFPYQREMYEVFGNIEVKDADAMKSTQVGVSELLTRLALYVADLFGMTALYVFPALKQMFDFSDMRVNPIRENSQYLQSRTKLTPEWTWNKGLKRIGAGFVNYRGSESKNDLVAVDADLAVLDEYDLLHMPNIPEAERRISGSLWGLLRRVGVPSDPEYGIAKRYAQSDMREWMVKCEFCKEDWQPLDFWKNLVWDEDDGGVVTNPAIVCRGCERPLDVLTGQWVAEHPDRFRPGFHVHRLMVPGTRNLIAVIEASKQRDPLLVKSFWNNDLGLPFADETGGLNRADLAAALSVGERWAREQGARELVQQAAYTGGNIVTMGVDVASVRALNVRISEHIDPLSKPGHRKRALFIGPVDSFNDLPGLMDRYGVHFAAIDHLPEGRLSYGFAAMFPGRVYVVSYASNQIDAIKVDTEAMRASVQRVPALDATVAIVRAQRNLLPADLPGDYVTHMVTPRRTVEKDEVGRMTVIWVERGPTDYFHAETYDVIAAEIAKVRMEVEHQTREEIWQLDERLEFTRSGVNDYDDQNYRPGPGSGDPMDYRSGPGDE